MVGRALQLVHGGPSQPSAAVTPSQWAAAGGGKAKARSTFLSHAKGQPTLLPHAHLHAILVLLTRKKARRKRASHVVQVKDPTKSYLSVTNDNGTPM